MSTAYVGNVSASLVRVGELFRDAVRLDASGVILVYDHPSGDPTPLGYVHWRNERLRGAIDGAGSTSYCATRK